MRGIPLSDPAVVGLLQPFVFTSWHGHRNDPDLPAAVKEIFDWKFHPGQPPGEQSNVDIALLNPKGRIVHSFDSYPFGRPDGRPDQSLPEYYLAELRKGRAKLGLAEAAGATRELALPALEDAGARGMRVITRFAENRMVAYQAPVVEAVPFGEAVWQGLAYPGEKRTVQAELLKPALAQIYPPGVMERTDSRTKVAFHIAEVSGDLQLSAAGSAGALRYALLEGKIRLTDSGGDGFQYEGRLRLVLAYEANEQTPTWVRGIFEGTYPRKDPRRNDTRQLGLTAVLESLPEATRE